MRIEQTCRDVATGRERADSSETEYNIFTTIPGEKNKIVVRQTFADYILRNYPTDHWGNPIPEDGITVECVEGQNGAQWTGRVRYEKPTPEESVQDDLNQDGIEYGSYVSGFSTAGGTAHIRRSLATTRYAIGGPAPDMFGQIGWNGEDFDGCDIITPNFAFEITSRTPPGAVEDFGSLADLIASFQGKTNAGVFCGFNPGCVLYTGVSSGSLQTAPATETTDEFYYWQITHTFQASPNVTLNVCGVPVPKPGWAYFWALTEKSWDPTTNRITPNIVAAYVETVYATADFARLGIGYNI